MNLKRYWNNFLGIMIIILVVAFVLTLLTGNFWIPCKYLGWVAVKDLPARCIMR